MRRSFRSLAREPNGNKIIRIFKNLVRLTLIRKSGFIDNLIDELLDITESALVSKADPEIAPGPVTLAKLSKQQYVAIVGVNTIGTKVYYKVAHKKGFNKSNIRVCDDVEGFKSGRYGELLGSANCVAIIFGSIPHSHRENIEKVYAAKAVMARTRSGTHGKLKITKTSLEDALDEVTAKIK